MSRTRTWFDPHLPDIQASTVFTRGAYGARSQFHRVEAETPIVVDGIPLLAASVRSRERAVGVRGWSDTRIPIGYYSPPGGASGVSALMRGAGAIGSGYLYTEAELRRDWPINFQRAGIYAGEPAVEHPTPRMVTVYWTRMIAAVITQIDAGLELPRRSAAWLDRLELAEGYTREEARADDPRLRRLSRDWEEENPALGIRVKSAAKSPPLSPAARRSLARSPELFKARTRAGRD